jgi:hypothetical protein
VQSELSSVVFLGGATESSGISVGLRGGAANVGGGGMHGGLVIDTFLLTLLLLGDLLDKLEVLASGEAGGILEGGSLLLTLSVLSLLHL